MVNTSLDYVVKTTNLTKIYKTGTIAVNNINISLKPGKIYGFLGPNGAGKTTALNMFMGLLKPTSGKIKVLGENPDSPKKFELRKHIGYMPQDIALYEDLTPYEHCLFFGRLNGMSKKAAHTSAEKLINFFGLEEKKHSPVHQLSGGLKRRTSLICAFVHQPSLFLLDEPTVGIDPVLRKKFWDFFRDLNTREQQVTFLVTTHVFDEVDRMDKILLIYEGKIIEFGTAHELKNKYAVNSLESVFLQVHESEENKIDQNHHSKSKVAY